MFRGYNSYVSWDQGSSTQLSLSSVPRRSLAMRPNLMVQHPQGSFCALALPLLEARREQ